ncbi:hypothetical protein MBT84_06130 [Streptomyces sp. MBT84]|nr:hypothetical protein [Streptomyces sp. MBT84]
MDESEIPCCHTVVDSADSRLQPTRLARRTMSLDTYCAVRPLGRCRAPAPGPRRRPTVIRPGRGPEKGIGDPRIRLTKTRTDRPARPAPGRREKSRARPAPHENTTRSSAPSDEHVPRSMPRARCPCRRPSHRVLRRRDAPSGCPPHTFSCPDRVDCVPQAPGVRELLRTAGRLTREAHRLNGTRGGEDVLPLRVAHDSGNGLGFRRTITRHHDDTGEPPDAVFWYLVCELQSAAQISPDPRRWLPQRHDSCQVSADPGAVRQPPPTTTISR